uniref:Tumor necrosis factor alpha-induced protein 8 n=1 Tax=Pavo cristatus TaxID=9049 RepID=A0A8C9FH18_PAVCR
MHNQQLLAREVRVSVEVLLRFQTAAGVLAPKGAESPEQLSPDLLNSQTFPLKIPTLLFFFSFLSFFFPPFFKKLACSSAGRTSAAGAHFAMSLEADESREVATDVFNSKSLAIQAQKKILGKMVSKSIATTLIDDTSSDVLDELYRVTKEYTQNKKEAEKIIKNLIKIVLKLAILYRNNQFNQDEIALMEKFKKKVHQLAKTVVSFHQVDYTFDRNFLSKLLNDCRELLHQIIQRHLTAKSHGRVNNVFDHFSDCEFLAALYNPFGPYKLHLQKLCDGVNRMLDEGNI